MLYLMPPEQYANLDPILPDFPALYPSGILSGRYEGQVIVDDRERPQAAWIRYKMWSFLLGDPTANDFAQKLAQAFESKRFIGEDTGAIAWIAPSAEWLSHLSNLLPHRTPIETPRSLFIADLNTPLSSPPLPDRFELHEITADLADKIDGELPGDVSGVLSLRASAQNRNQAALGMVITHGRTIVAWAVIDFIVDHRGEIRLVTDRNYRRQGLATIVSAAAIQLGRQHRLSEILWDVATHNRPSVRTAEKLGLRLASTHSEYLIIFSELGYWVNTAFSFIDQGKYEEGLTLAQEIRQKEDKSLQRWGSFVCGVASAGLGKAALAFVYLHEAIDRGFEYADEMERAQPLQVLAKTPEWDALIDRIR